jgi:hypothetical protein
VTPEELIWAAPMYEEMIDYKLKTDDLLKTAAGKQLSAEKQQLLEQARQFYGWYDYLDSFRLATAALS